MRITTLYYLLRTQILFITKINSEKFWEHFSFGIIWWHRNPCDFLLRIFSKHYLLNMRSLTCYNCRKSCSKPEVSNECFKSRLNKFMIILIISHHNPRFVISRNTELPHLDFGFVVISSEARSCSHMRVCELALLPRRVILLLYSQAAKEWCDLQYSIGHVRCHPHA